jgi:hypothetical protein
MSSREVHRIGRWVKATASSQGADCVELRRRVGVVEVRDSKDPHGPVLQLSGAQFTAWLSGARSGEYSPLTD